MIVTEAGHWSILKSFKAFSLSKFLQMHFYDMDLDLILKFEKMHIVI